MNTLRYCGIVLLWVAALIVGGGAIQSAAATDSPSVSQPATPAASGDDKERDHEHDRPKDRQDGEDSDDHDDHGGAGESEDRAERDSDWMDHDERSGARHHRHGRELVNIGRDSDLPAGERADSVVSIIGSSIAAGDASDVVSLLGDTTVTGSVRHSAVPV